MGNPMRPIIGIENHTPQEVFDIMRDRIAALIAAGDKLAGYANGHHGDCRFETMFAYEQPCTCGYTEAQQAWLEARGHD